MPHENSTQVAAKITAGLKKFSTACNSGSPQNVTTLSEGLKLPRRKKSDEFRTTSHDRNYCRGQP